MIKIYLITLVLLALSSCAGRRLISRNEIPTKKITSQRAMGNSLLSQIESDVDLIAQRQKKIEIPHAALESKRSNFVQRPRRTNDFSLSYPPKLYKHWMKYYTTRNKKRFLRHLKNGAKYKSVVSKVFKKHGLPEELFFVGLIESGFISHARSHADAVGPWQFIKGTAKRYGLKVNRSVDERQNIHKSTEAAANYFKDLYNIFGSWELALCAYNAGEYRIINVIRKGNTRDYRELVKKRLLPKETIYYIPKVAAAMELSRKRDFIIKNEREDTFYKKGEILRVKKPFSLRSLAKKSKISFSILKKYNPDLKRREIRPGRYGHRLIVPRNFKKRIAEVTRSLKEGKYKKTKSRKRKIASTKKALRYYNVKKGDSLSLISKRFNTRMSNLKKWNRLKGNKLYVNQVLVVSKGLNKVKRSRRIRSKRLATYVVRKGDNLFAIARRFKTSIRKIVRVNSLKKNTIYPSQRILIPAES